MALDTVGDYLAEARILLQDTFVPYRYTEADMKTAMGLAIYEMRKLRPDLFIGRMEAVPEINAATANATAVVMDRMYRLSILYFIVGHMHMRDEEEAAEARAQGYKQRFVQSLLTVAV